MVQETITADLLCAGRACGAGVADLNGGSCAGGDGQGKDRADGSGGLHIGLTERKIGYLKDVEIDCESLKDVMFGEREGWRVVLDRSF